MLWGEQHMLGKRETASIRDAESGRNPSLFLEKERLRKRRKSAALKVNLESLAGE